MRHSWGRFAFGVHEVALQLLGVASAELEWLMRNHDLAHIAEPLGELGVVFARRLTVRPDAGEAVVGDTPEEHDVGIVRRVDHP